MQLNTEGEEKSLKPNVTAPDKLYYTGSLWVKKNIMIK